MNEQQKALLDSFIGWVNHRFALGYTKEHIDELCEYEFNERLNIIFFTNSNIQNCWHAWQYQNQQIANSQSNNLVALIDAEMTEAKTELQFCQFAHNWFQVKNIREYVDSLQTFRDRLLNKLTGKLDNDNNL